MTAQHPKVYCKKRHIKSRATGIEHDASGRLGGYCISTTAFQARTWARRKTHPSPLKLNPTANTKLKDERKTKWLLRQATKPGNNRLKRCFDCHRLFHLLSDMFIPVVRRLGHRGDDIFHFAFNREMFARGHKQSLA